MPDRFAPILPSRDFDATQQFYETIGFELVNRREPPDFTWMIVGRNDLWLHFFPHEHDPHVSNWMVYLHLENPDEWADAYRTLGLPKTGIPRFGDILDREWGMREFSLVDPDGTLLRIGRPLT